MSLLGWMVGAGLAWGLGRGEVASFERAAAADIASKLEGPAKSVKVRSQLNGLLGPLTGELSEAWIDARNFSTPGLPLFTEPERSARGKVGKLHIDLQNFRLGSLDVRSLKATLPDCRYDLGLARRKKQIRLSRSGVGSGEVIIEEDALERFILTKFKVIQSVEVRCDRGFIWVEGQGEFLLIQTSFRVLAKLEPEGGSRLMLVRPRIAFDGLPVEPAAGQAVLDTLNPVVDLNKDLNLYGAISLEGVDARDGVLRAWGKTRIPHQPRKLP